LADANGAGFSPSKLVFLCGRFAGAGLGGRLEVDAENLSKTRTILDKKWRYGYIYYP
jgi:hypothetical protein